MSTALVQPLVTVNLQSEEVLMSNRSPGFTGATNVGTLLAAHRYVIFSLCKTLLEAVRFASWPGTSWHQTSNMHRVTVRSNLDLAHTVGNMKCLIADPIG